MNKLTIPSSQIRSTIVEIMFDDNLTAYYQQAHKQLLECKYKLLTGRFYNKYPGEQFARGGSIPPVPFVTHQDTWVIFARILLGFTPEDRKRSHLKARIG